MLVEWVAGALQDRFFAPRAMEAADVHPISGRVQTLASAVFGCGMALFSAMFRYAGQGHGLIT